MKIRGGPKPGYSPTLFLYEHVPGGTGLAEHIYAQRDVLLGRTLRLIERCPCEAGCPTCVGPSDPMALGMPQSRKSVALELLQGVLAA